MKDHNRETLEDRAWNKFVKEQAADGIKVPAAERQRIGKTLFFAQRVLSLAVADALRDAQPAFDKLLSAISKIGKKTGL